MHKKRRKNRLSYYAKILFAISLTLLLYGFILNIRDNRKVLDPVDDVEIYSEDESTVTITTSDGSEVIPGDVVVSDGDKENQNTGTGTIPSPNNPNPNNDASSTSIEDSNQKLRLEIQNTYGVMVRYGEETNGYEVGGFTTTSIEDPNVVRDQLNHLKNTLDLYPKGLFTEIKNGGIPLSVYLIHHYSNQNITGVTDSSYTYATISIAAAHPFEESFYHESYHYIERYLFKRGASFTSWDTINPAGFTYGVVDQRLSYTYGLDANAPFVNDYAQSAATEDRASTFEYMMASSKASCLNKGTIVHTKANQMALMIDAVLNSVSPNVTEYWERYL